MKKKISKQTAAQFATYSTETQLLLNNITNFLKKQWGGVAPEWGANLEMIATSWELYLQCKESINTNGLLITDRFGVQQKNPLIKVMMDAMCRVDKGISELGISPKSAMKLKALGEDEENSFLDALIND